MKPLNSSKSHQLFDFVPSVKPSVLSVILSLLLYIIIIIIIIINFFLINENFIQLKKNICTYLTEIFEVSIKHYMTLRIV